MTSDDARHFYGGPSASVLATVFQIFRSQGQIEPIDQDLLLVPSNQLFPPALFMAGL
jgi:hypothetical protein